MALIVMKFGGTSVGDIDRIKNAAAKVAAEIQRGHKVAVVVSAMSGVTDQLIGFCRSVSPHFDQREYDVIVSSGEQVTAGLMALALHQYDLNARSWQGWQVRLMTDGAHGKARIVDVEVEALHQRILDGEVGVMAGFQGVTPDGRISTLGRGGSDTSAVALAVALQADRCDIYTDVDGVYTTDPNVVASARKIERVSYEEMLELASLGAKVLQVRSVEMAMRFGMPVQVLSTFADAIGSDLPGTLVTKRDQAMEQEVVTGIAYTKDQTRITMLGVPDRPGSSAAIFSALARAEISVDMIVQPAAGVERRTAKADRRTVDVERRMADTRQRTADTMITVVKADAERAIKALEEEQKKIGYQRLTFGSDVTKISLVGAGMRSHPGVAALMFQTLAEKSINVLAIETSEISISVLVADEYRELALRALHTAYGLDALERSTHANSPDHRGQSRPRA